MSKVTVMSDEEKIAEFQDAASGRRPRITSDIWSFVWRNKRWWMIPMIAILMLLGFVVLLGSSGVGAFIYPLF